MRPERHDRENVYSENNDTKNETSFGADLRRLQSQVNCTNKTLLDIIQLFVKHTGLKLTKNLTQVDKELRKASGFSFLRLHGCPKCGVHVYEPGDDRDRCPHVKQNGEVCGQGRYENGKPLEVCLHDVLMDIYISLLFVLLGGVLLPFNSTTQGSA